MATVNLFRSASAYTSVKVLQLGEITSGQSTYVEAFQSVSGMDVAVYLNDYMNPDDYSGTHLNFIALDGQPTGYYSTADLINGFIATGYINEITGYRTFNLILNNTQVASCNLSYEDYTLTYKPSLGYLALATVNGTPRIGILGINDRVPSSPSYRQYNAFFTNAAWSDKMLEELEFQRKGSRPIGDIGKHQRGGGDGDGGIPSYYTGTINLPGEPDETKASAIGAGFITAYDITEAMLTNLGKVLYDPSYLSGIANFFINPLDAVISLNVFPYIPHIASSTYVKLLKYYCKSEYFGVDVTAFPLAKQFRTVSFGTLQIPEVWQSFLDYEATSISLYLPFIGEVSLDASDVMGGSITVEYTIDFFTGMCVANVSCERGIQLDDAGVVPSKSVHSYQGNCAIQIPLSAADYGSMVGALVSAASAGLTTGIAGVGMSLASGAASGAFKPTVTSKGSISANAGFCSVLYPYITITRPITAEPVNYQTVMGYPSYVNGRLADYQDLCVCDNIDLTAITSATRSELDEIRKLCQEGVYV